MDDPKILRNFFGLQNNTMSYQKLIFDSGNWHLIGSENHSEKKDIQNSTPRGLSEFAQNT
jgi:hypothetical protein